MARLTPVDRLKSSSFRFCTVLYRMCLLSGHFQHLCKRSNVGWFPRFARFQAGRFSLACIGKPPASVAQNSLADLVASGAWYSASRFLGRAPGLPIALQGVELASQRFALEQNRQACKVASGAAIRQAAIWHGHLARSCVIIIVVFAVSSAPCPQVCEPRPQTFSWLLVGSVNSRRPTPAAADSGSAAFSRSAACQKSCSRSGEACQSRRCR